MSLYEETVSSRMFQLLMILPMAAMLWGTYQTYQAGEGFEIMAASTIGALIILLDVMAIRIEIDDRELRIRGVLGLLVRKTISLENIASFRVGKSWTLCYGMIHFNLPAKGCVTIRQKHGWSVSFTTNRPEEVAMVLSTLGIPREP
ncbi:hypothetical membrane protein, conserved [Thermococcus onnurineus NA1]|uniref:Hypothetical membrane protein, conserved n=1 Tax=Thermococcus onnurineus (strain NA1) TaxID=523850 RepID=B6YX98_THEON|nr:hypothetical protein [Thermococcus onnurineus]ACJ16711.1 hypothetical membrane protein, conserved [Thermococcus onnurineus NA1]